MQKVIELHVKVCRGSDGITCKIRRMTYLHVKWLAVALGTPCRPEGMVVELVETTMNEDGER